MYQLSVRILAQKDIQEIVDYYEEHAPTIVDRFLNSLYAEFDRIQTNPQISQKKYKQTSVSYVKGFPYGIHFFVQKNTIHILAILHTGRNPQIWETR